MNALGKRGRKGGGGGDASYDNLSAKRLCIGDTNYCLPTGPPASANQIISSLSAGPDADTAWIDVPNVGGITDHTQLTSIGVNTHAQLDQHVTSIDLRVTDLEGKTAAPPTTDNAIARFDGANSKLQNSTATLDDAGNAAFASVSSALVENTGNLNLTSQSGNIELTAPAGQIVLEDEPLIGDVGTGYTLPTVRGSEGDQLRVAGGGVEFFTPEEASFANVYFDAGAPGAGGVVTAIPVVSTWYDIAGARVLPSATPDFTLVGDDLIYSGPSKDFLLTQTLSTQAAGSADNYYGYAVRITRGGITLLPSQSVSKYDSDNARQYPACVTTSSIFRLETGDSIIGVTTNFESAQGIRIYVYQLCLTEITAGGSAGGGGGGGGGDVVGPASSTDNALCRYDGGSGKLIQNSLALVADDGELSITTPFQPGLNLSDSLNDYRLGMVGGVLRLEKTDGGADTIFDSQANRFNVKRNSWLQGTVEINAEPDNYLLPLNRPTSAGQILTAASTTTTQWANVPTAKIQDFWRLLGNTVVTNTLTETSIIYGNGGPGLLPSFTPTANGDEVRFKAQGTLVKSGSPLLSIRVKVNGVVIAANIMSLSPSIASGGSIWNIEGAYQYRTVGVVGQIQFVGSLEYIDTAERVFRFDLSENIVPIQTNDLQTFDLTVQWGSIGVTNSISMERCLWTSSRV